MVCNTHIFLRVSYFDIGLGSLLKPRIVIDTLKFLPLS